MLHNGTDAVDTSDNDVANARMTELEKEKEIRYSAYRRCELLYEAHEYLNQGLITEGYFRAREAYERFKP